MVCALTTEFLLLYGVPAQKLLDEVGSIYEVFSYFGPHIIKKTMFSKQLQAGEVSNSAFYHCQWYLPNLISIRKSFMIIIHRSQKAVSLSAGGLIDINRQTVVSVSIIQSDIM